MTLGRINRAFWASFAPAASPDEHRNRAVVRTMLGAYALKAVTLAVNLVSVPLASGYLGLERYGLWLAMSSVIGILALSDFGLANNLTTLLAQARGREDTDAASRQVSATVWAVSAAAATGLLVFAVAYPMVSWPTVFNATTSYAAGEATRAALVLGLVAAVQLVGGLCQRVYAGLQQGYWGSVWSGAGSIAGLLALLAVARLHGGLVALALALGLVPLLVQVAGLAWILTRGGWGRLLAPTVLRWADYRHVLGGGALMFIVNLQSVFWLTKDNLLVAHTLGLSEVGRYNTAFRVFYSVFSLAVGALLSSLWPAYADAFSRRNYVWINKTLKHSLSMCIGSMACFGCTFSIVGRHFLKWYVGDAMSLHLLEIALLSVYFVFLAASNTYSILLAGAGKLAIVGWSGLVGGIISLPLCIWAAHHWGLAGVISANCSCILLCQTLPTSLQTHRMITNKYITEL